MEAAPSIWDPHRARAEAGAELPLSDVVGGAVTVGPAGSFQTVSAAVNWAKNDPGVGFTISIQAGVYREKLPEIDERMIIRAAPGASVTISGATLYAKTGWSAPNGSGVRSLVVTEMSQPPGAPGGPGAGPNPPVYPAIPYPQDQAVTSPAVALVEQLFWVNAAGVPSPLTQVVFTGPGQTPGVDQFYYNPYDDKIYALFSTGTWDNAAGFEVASRDTAVRITGNADDSKLIGIEFSYFSPPLLAPTVANPDPTNDSHWGDGRAVIELAGVSSNYLTGVELRDVRVLNSATTAINIDRSTGTTLTRVTNQWNGARGLNANRSDGLRIEYSRFDNNNYLGFDNTGSCGNCRMAGVKITRSGRADDGEPGGGNGPGSVVVRYSSFNANNAQGLWCDLDCANGVIVGNWAGGNTGTGIYWEVSKDATISSNLLVGNGTGGLHLTSRDGVRVLSDHR